MFEALACGIPIVSAPWSDLDGLFPEDTYLKANNGEQMLIALKTLLRDPELAHTTARQGLRVIAERHTCRHRALQLLDIVESIGGPRRRTTRSQQEGALA